MSSDDCSTANAGPARRQIGGGRRALRSCYSLYQRDQYSAADTELKRIDIESIALAAERYRVSILHGNTLRMLGQAEAALPFLERGLDLAHEMRMKCAVCTPCFG